MNCKRCWPKLCTCAAKYRAARQRLGTQAKVAALLGVSRVTIARRENGTRSVSNEAFFALKKL